MAPNDRRERERLALRARIMKTARRLFAEKGYDAVTMRMIADTIEYSPRTIYLHFEDKEDLIWKLCMEDFETFGKGMSQLLAIKDPVDRLRQLGLAYAGYARTNPHHYRLMFMTRAPLSDAPHEPYAFKGNPESDAYELLVVCMSEAIAQGRLRKQFQDPHLVAQITWAAIHGVIALELTYRGEDFIPWVPLEKRVTGVLDMIELGLLEQPPSEKPKATLVKSRRR